MRIGIIGCGRVVEEGHAPALRPLIDSGRVEVVGLADPSQERRTEVKKALGDTPAAEYDTWGEMLGSELDAVLVAVPHYLHARAITDAAAAQVDMFVEKPLGLNLDEVDRIAGIVEGRRVSIIHNWRFNPDIVAAADAIKEGRLGDVTLIRNEMIFGTPWASKDPNSPGWRFDRTKSGGGVVIDMIYHAIYLAETFARSPVEKVTANLANNANSGTVEDTAVITLTHASGASTCIQRSWAVAAGGIAVHEVHGSEGSIRFRQLDSVSIGHIMRGDYAALRSQPQAPVSPPVEIFENAADSWRPLPTASEEMDWWIGMRRIYERTLDAWDAAEEAPVGVAAARHNIAVIEAIYSSGAREAVVDLAELES
jgi:predicted dehydrogenase